MLTKIRWHLAGLLITLALFLVSCQTTTAPPPAPRLIPCASSLPAEPAWPLDALPLTANIFEKGRAAIAEVELRIAYELTLKAALTSCNTDDPAKPRT